jgi:tetratricopeptide (TPR) repeat protein
LLVPRLECATSLGPSNHWGKAFEPAAKVCGEATEFVAHQTALAKDDVVKALLCSGSAALALGRPNDALDAANRAQTALLANVSPPAEPNQVTQMLVIDLRARALRDSGRNSEALPAYREELAVAHKVGDTGSEGAAWSQIAYVQRQMGLNKEADESCVAGLAVLDSDNAARPRANLLNTRAFLATTSGRQADAVPLFESSLALRRTEAVTEPQAIATGERDLADTLSVLGRYDQAGRHMDTAIDGYRALGDKRRPFLVVALNRRVSIAVTAGDPQRAESVLGELLPLQDPTGDDAVKTRLDLADLQDNQTHREDATAYGPRRYLSPPPNTVRTVRPLCTSVCRCWHRCAPPVGWPMQNSLPGNASTEPRRCTTCCCRALPRGSKRRLPPGPIGSRPRSVPGRWSKRRRTGPGMVRRSFRC